MRISYFRTSKTECVYNTSKFVRSKKGCRMRYLAISLLSSFLLSSCTTVFQGSAYVKDGVLGCQNKCKSWGMELSGMVAMGEYSDGCICKKTGVSADSAFNAGAAEAAVAGVEMQRQREEQQRQSGYQPGRQGPGY
jgi:hypothetical protein